MFYDSMAKLSNNIVLSETFVYNTFKHYKIWVILTYFTGIFKYFFVKFSHVTHTYMYNIFNKHKTWTNSLDCLERKFTDY
jgi:hypothetical protein